MARANPARKPILAGNWKMNKNHLEAIGLVQKLHYLLRAEDHDKAEVVVCPPFTALRAVQTLIEGDNSRILLGAQNCHWESHGAYTGEIAPPMLARLKCSYVIVGHSERRARFAETDEIVNKKAKAVFIAGMTPIVCVGETLDQREAGETEAVVGTQVRGSLAGLSAEQLENVVVAYEPVWAIGTGRNAQPADASAVCGLIRTTVKEIGGNPDAVRIQYGGSVNPGNIKDFMAEPEIDGALVGGASLDPEDFALIVRYRD
jgi:triosephosphate isomerase